tara:strand:- start:1100 stop:2806 length:1707 start_codon:yes stop_codon:yes gene_type:complete
MNKKNNYHQQNKSYLLSNIPLTSNSILEFGCNNGYLGYEFKKRQPFAKYFGIESVKNFNIISKKRLDKVYKTNFEDTLKLRHNIPPLDCLIYSNSLESINNPWELIPGHLEWLMNDGAMILFIQNIQHWSIIQELLESSSQLSEYEILNNSFGLYSIKNIREKLFRNGLSLCSIIPIIFNLEEIIAFTSKIDQTLNNFNIDRNEFIRRISPKQYMFVAKKGIYKRFHIDILKTKVNPAVIADSRIDIPYRALNTLVDMSIPIGKETTTLLPKNSNIPKIIILNRKLNKKNETSKNRIKTLLKNGYLIVIDIDDDPSHLLEKDTNYNFSLSSCHAIQVSTNEIAKKILHLNPEIKVFANVIEKIGDKKNKIDNNSEIKIFFGALNRVNDWKPWIDSLNQGLSFDIKKWKFEIIHDELFYNSINLPSDQKKFTPLCSYSKYLEIMSNCDICFMPLLNNSFNKCKSDLKALEAASFSLAILSNPVVYNQTFINGKTAKFFDNNHTLISILKNWAEDPNQVRELGMNAREYVLTNRMASQQVKIREEWYKNLWKRKDELRASLLQREPEFKL